MYTINKSGFPSGEITLFVPPKQLTALIYGLTLSLSERPKAANRKSAIIPGVAKRHQAKKDYFGDPLGPPV